MLKIAQKIRKESASLLTKEEKKVIKGLKDVFNKNFMAHINKVEKGIVDSNSIELLAIRMALGVQKFSNDLIADAVKSLNTIIKKNR